MNEVTGAFVAGCRAILGGALVGVYLHGSAAMNCFNPMGSDIDILVVVDDDITDAVKRRLMDMAVALNARAPRKGIEFSVVRRNVCKPFAYPTPFLLHFSVAHLDWYASNPEDYIQKMNGKDRDLAAHFAVIRGRGKRLWGAPIEDVFGEVSRAAYLDSVWGDIESAEADIAENLTYAILNLCRTLAYLDDNVVRSKREGGLWALARVPEEYRTSVKRALSDYASDCPAPWTDEHAREFAAFMLGEIRSAINA